MAFTAFMTVDVVDRFAYKLSYLENNSIRNGKLRDMSRNKTYKLVVNCLGEIIIIPLGSQYTKAKRLSEVVRHTQ